MFASRLANIVSSCNYSIIMDIEDPHNIELHRCVNFSSKMGLISSKIDTVRYLFYYGLIVCLDPVNMYILLLAPFFIAVE